MTTPQLETDDRMPPEVALETLETLFGDRIREIDRRFELSSQLVRRRNPLTVEGMGFPERFDRFSYIELVPQINEMPYLFGPSEAQRALVVRMLKCVVSDELRKRVRNMTVEMYAMARVSCNYDAARTTSDGEAVELLMGYILMRIGLAD